ncbi:hypothetical protein [Streptomyces hokutonensis]|uniref:hypothetical protein n=1 Tax=Streptomyces hokutonensis TaxID=1306990 RepID=UPI003678CC6A
MHVAEVDFGRGDLTGCHGTTARRAPLHDPARVPRDIEARQRVLNRLTLSPAAESDPRTSNRRVRPGGCGTSTPATT